MKPKDVGKQLISDDEDDDEDESEEEEYRQPSKVRTFIHELSFNYFTFLCTHNSRQLILQIEVFLNSDQEERLHGRRMQWSGEYQQGIEDASVREILSAQRATKESTKRSGLRL